MLVVTTPSLSEKQKAYLRRVRGIKKPFSVDAQVSTEVKKVRKFNAPMVRCFVPAKPRGRSGCRLDHGVRLQILCAAETKLEKRRAFFAAMGVSV